ncbi:J domain-containing protein [Amycolatopsis sp.]|uniref:J domain-containing protein n=1 Tax=Amycolatopsis sp. TaxID=37632 RepID=UPI002B60D4CA|nr:J domain-containing protein [Amycolatopsis sp.]HVV08406.1 J domain-containing protein [Amycolatopsis sp.]
MNPDPYRILGVAPGATPAEITTAYRRALRACHPDTADYDPDRLAAVLAAYRLLHDHAPARPADPGAGQAVPVRVHRSPTPAEPDVRAGPVRRHYPL